MDFKGTKGKWEVEFDAIGYPSVLNEGGNFICDVIGADIEAKANAQLISSAPELLQALDDLVTAIESNKLILAEEIHNAKQVIEKATKID